jgi:hypothetical protein
MYIPNIKIQFHLKHRQGTFTLVSFDNDFITYKTKHRQIQQVPFYKFKCLHGKTDIGNPTVLAFCKAVSINSTKSPDSWGRYIHSQALDWYDSLSKDELHKWFNRDMKIY